jgi:hypothetical protein
MRKHVERRDLKGGSIFNEYTLVPILAVMSMQNT